MRLGYQCDAVGNVPVKVIARTFASGKTERLVYQCLADMGLPCEKVVINLIKHLINLINFLKIPSFRETLSLKLNLRLKNSSIFTTKSVHAVILKIYSSPCKILVYYYLLNY